MNTKCWECEHFKINYEPLRSGPDIYDLGRASCKKYDLIVDFASHRKLKRLVCADGTMAVQGKEKL